ncbi:MAG: prepilin-type N-terminal cleavage/methylation domain-containing protein [Alkalibacterium sp.]|nr:prepilin-type N-terminal cleavage/methylation domain-containing protein [Alkalibacterium sp.]
MVNRLKREDGLTLVELLASLAILSVVILLVGSVHIFGQTQFISQTESAGQSNDLRYSLTVISRDVRQAEEISFESGELRLGASTYSHSGTELRRNGELLSSRVQSFTVSGNNFENDFDEKAIITLDSTPNRQGKTQTYETTIYFRR